MLPSRICSTKPSENKTSSNPTSLTLKTLRFSVWVRLLCLSGLLWRMRLTVGVVLRGLCVSLIGKRLRSLWILCRSFASAGGNATNPILFEPFAMSIILGQQERIRKLVEVTANDST